jgi:hypothetical protein
MKDASANVLGIEAFEMFLMTGMKHRQSVQPFKLIVLVSRQDSGSSPRIATKFVEGQEKHLP